MGHSRSVSRHTWIITVGSRSFNMSKYNLIVIRIYQSLENANVLKKRECRTPPPLTSASYPISI